MLLWLLLILLMQVGKTEVPFYFMVSMAYLSLALLLATPNIRKHSGCAALDAPQDDASQPSISAAVLQTAEDIDGKEQPMRQYAGKVLLITNVASECGFTDSNYRGLQKLYEKFQSRGFEV